MKRNQPKSNRLDTLAAAIIIIAATVPGFSNNAFADAPVYTWNGNGGDSNFGTGANWSGGSAPGGNTLQYNLHFAGSTKLTPNNNYPDLSGGYRIFFDSGAGAFTITGNRIKFSDYSGINPQIENDSSSLQTINIGFGVGSGAGGTMMSINPTSGDMAFGASSGNVFYYFDDAGKPLTIGGGNGHVVTFWGAIGNGAASARFVLAQNSIVIFKAQNGYSGETDINAGELRIDSGGDITSSSGIYLGDSTSSTVPAQLTLSAAAGGMTWSRAFTVNPISSGVNYSKRTIAGGNTSGNNICSGNITLNGDVTLSAASGGTVTFTGQLYNNSTVRTAHATNSPGTVVLGGTADNLNLAVVVDSGTVQLSKSVASGTHAERGGLTVNSGGTAQLGPNSAGDEIYDSSDVTVNSGGVFDLNGQTETIRNFNLSGPGIGSGGALMNNNGSTTSTLTASGGTALGAASSIGGSASITLPNAIGDGSHGYALTKVGAGTLTLSGANTYSGGTTIKAGAIVFSGSSTTTSGPLGPSNSVVTLGDTTGSAGATVAHSGAAVVHYYPITVQSGSSGTKTLADVSSASVGYISNIVLNDSVTLDPGASGDIILNGPVTGSGGINKVGIGLAQLNAPGGANTFTGGITISQGTNQLGSSTAIPNGSGKGIVTLNPAAPNTATLDLHGNNQTINGLASSGTGSAVVDNVSSVSKTLTVGTSGSNPGGTYSGVIQNSGAGTLSLTKAGSGALTLGGANTYGGNTTISAGTLALGGSGSINNSTNITIAAGATFDVSAYAAYTLGGSNALGASGTGTTVGTSAAVVKGGTTVSLGSQPVWLTFTPAAFAGDTAHPALLISQGALALGNNTITINNAAATKLGAGAYRLIQVAGGAISGTPNAAPAITGTGLATGTTASVTVSGGNVNLMVVETTATTLSRTAGVSTQTYGSTLTFIATVTGNATTPGGNVIFKDGPTTLATVALVAGTAPTAAATYTSYTDLGVNGGMAHSIAAFYQGDSAHNSSDSSASPISQTISAKALSVSGITAGSTVYDGTASARLGGSAVFQSAESAGTVSDGRPYSVDSVWPGTVTGTLAAKDVGAQAVTITGVAVAGAGDGNYTVTPQSGLTQIITAKALSVCGLAACNKVYDGTARALLMGSTNLQPAEAAGSGSDGRPYSGDPVGLTGTPCGTFAGANAANGICVSVTGLSLANNAAGDYSLTAPSFTANITPAGTAGAVSSSANPALPGTIVGLTNTLVAPGGGAPTGPVLFKTNGVACGSAISLGGLAAGFSIASLPHGSNVITAEYAGDGNFFGTTNNLSPGEVIDTPPGLAAHFFGTPVNTALFITNSALASLDFDADGDALAISAATGASTNGGTVAFCSGVFTYTPAGGYVGQDVFTYAVCDGFPGGTVTNSIVVTVRAAGGAACCFPTNGISPPVNNTVCLTGYGIPESNYEIQVSGDLSGWSTIGSTNALGNGLILFTDLNATNSPRYYRIVAP